MLAIERRNLIFEQIKAEKKVIVSDLSHKFNVSEETIRRDLDKLDKEGFVKKSYGGAVLNDDIYLDIPFNVRKNTNVDGKLIIADLLENIIEDNDRIMIDASSTAVFASKAFRKKEGLTVITNSLEIAIKLSDSPTCHIIAAGGNVESVNLAVSGHVTEQFLQSYYVDKAIISCRGLSSNGYITDSKESIAFTKQAMIGAARKTILLIDASKLNSKSFVKICSLSQIDIIITDAKPGEKWLRIFKDYNIDVRYPSDL